MVQLKQVTHNLQAIRRSEEVYLSICDNVIDAVHFVNMPTDMSYARVPNGIGVFTYPEETLILKIKYNIIN